MSVLHLFQRQFDRFFPFHCQQCGKPANTDMELCDACEMGLPWLLGGCSICSRPLPTGHSDDVCGHCIRQHPAYDRLLALFTYKTEIQQRIIEMKFRRSTSAARLLGQLMARAAVEEFSDCSLLVPVPMYPRRQRQRGYNQSLELAKVMAAEGPWQVSTTALRKTRATLPQMGLSATARRRNLKGSFLASADVSGKKVLLVDDVVTTDSTVNECVKALHKAEADEVNVITVARAIS